MTEQMSMFEPQRREPDKMLNRDACLNPIMWYHGQCEGCHFFRQCAYVKKGEYGKAGTK